VKILISTIVVGGVICVGATWGASSMTGCVDQPGMACLTAAGPFVTKLTLTSGAEDCRQTNSLGPYDTVSMFPFPQGTTAAVDFTQPMKVGIQSEELAAVSAGRDPDPDSSHHLYAFGTFTSANPSSASLCLVPTADPAVQTLPAAPAVPATDAGAGRDALPATSWTYTWSNLRFLVSPTYQGTQFAGTLSVNIDGCEATYDALGIYPAVTCDDDQGNKDPNLCNPDFVQNPPSGSGINQDFPIECADTSLGADMCVLKEGSTFPAIPKP
jgi:hypothetical protein